jgi:hypothetical protein
LDKVEPPEQEQADAGAGLADEEQDDRRGPPATVDYLPFLRTNLPKASELYRSFAQSMSNRS